MFISSYRFYLGVYWCYIVFIGCIEPVDPIMKDPYVLMPFGSSQAAEQLGELSVSLLFNTRPNHKPQHRTNIAEPYLFPFFGTHCGQSLDIRRAPSYKRRISEDVAEPRFPITVAGSTF